MRGQGLGISAVTPWGQLAVLLLMGAQRRQANFPAVGGGGLCGRTSRDDDPTQQSSTCVCVHETQAGAMEGTSLRLISASCPGSGVFNTRALQSVSLSKSLITFM